MLHDGYCESATSSHTTSHLHKHDVYLQYMWPVGVKKEKKTKQKTTYCFLASPVMLKSNLHLFKGTFIINKVIFTKIRQFSTEE